MEPVPAFAQLDTFRAKILAKPPTVSTKRKDKAKKRLKTIVEAITLNSSGAFGGFGHHLANDFLFYVAIHPCLAVYTVCADDAMWRRLREGIVPYMSTWKTKQYTNRCVFDANSPNPFAFSEVSNNNYLTTFTKVYYKRWVRMSKSLYNLYVSLGYLSKTHIVGESTVSDFRAQDSLLYIARRGI